MPENVKKAVDKDGKAYEFVFRTDPPGGAMKDVYFSPDGSYVVGIFKKPLDPKGMDRLESITEKYRHDIFDQVGGDYWKELFCWPEKVVKWEGKTGIVVPAYAKHFFFQYDQKLKGKEKQGRWFLSAKLFRSMPREEKGDFLSYLKIAMKLARAVRRMHAAGLAHSDLSYKNVLIDPRGGNACIIDVDGLVVPGKYAPDVIGTPDFIAPEVLCDKTGKVLPSQYTDKYALAVLIYMYLLHRHPLRGGRFFGPDVDNEEEMLLGSQPLYIEHPTDRSNRNMKREYGNELEICRPWVDLDNFSAARIAGPFLAPLFEKAFIQGLKEASKRPPADEWERAVIKTTDRLQPCSNPNCSAKWYVYDGARHPRCPFCGTEYKGLLPKLEFYSCLSGHPDFKPENYQLMVYNGQGLYRWHVTKRVFPNEKLSSTDKERQGYFQLYNGRWILVNERMTSLYERMSDGSKVQKKPGEYIELTDGKVILLSTEEGGRLIVVQMAGK